MGKQRYVDTKFWSDSYIINREPLERYLFLYFLTNEHTNIAGIYELPIGVMARETGLSISQIAEILPRLKSKIHYLQVLDDDAEETSAWIYIKNFAKHQQVNDKIKKGIDAVMDNLPTKIKKELIKVGLKL
jgi:hypothetical protein